MKKVFLYTLTVFFLFSMLAQVSAPAQEVIFPESFTGGLGHATSAIANNQSQPFLRFKIAASTYYETYPVDNIVLGGTSGIEPPPPPSKSNPYQRGPDPTAGMLEACLGPFNYASTRVSSGSGFGGGTLFFPIKTTEGPFAAIAVCPGYRQTSTSIDWWGPRLASEGFVVIAMNTKWEGDEPTSRATQLIAALNYVVRQSNQAGSPIYQKVDPNRRGVMGWSMGGGGALIAARDNPSLKGVIPLAPWTSSPSNFSGVTVPTLIVGCEADILAPVNIHALPFYNSFSSSLPKAYIEFSKDGHFCVTTDNDHYATLGKYGIAWMKRFLDNDIRYEPFLCGAPHKDDLLGQEISAYIEDCPYAR